MRWIRKDARPSNRGCQFCGSCRTGQDCSIETCKACGSPQCQHNGGSNGCCGVCHIGILTGWSGHDRPCHKKGCKGRAVAEAPRGSVCSKHALTEWFRTRRQKTPGITVAEYIQEQVDKRELGWRMR